MTIDVRNLILTQDEIDNIQEKRLSERRVHVVLPEYYAESPTGDPMDLEIRRVQGKRSDWSLIILPSHHFVAVKDNLDKHPVRVITGTDWADANNMNWERVYDTTKALNPLISQMPEEIPTDAPWLESFKKELKWRRCFFDTLRAYPKIMDLFVNDNTSMSDLMVYSSGDERWHLELRRWGMLPNIRDNVDEIYDEIHNAHPIVNRHKQMRGDVTNDEIRFVSSFTPYLTVLSRHMGPLSAMYLAELCHVTFDVQTAPASRRSLLGEYGYRYYQSGSPIDEEQKTFEDALSTIENYGISLTAPDIMDYVIGSMIRQGYDVKPLAFFCDWAVNLKLQEQVYGEISNERPNMLLSENQRLSKGLHEQIAYIAKNNIESLPKDVLENEWNRAIRGPSDEFYRYKVRGIDNTALFRTLCSKAELLDTKNEYLLAKGNAVIFEVEFQNPTTDIKPHYGYGVTVKNPGAHSTESTSSFLSMGEGNFPRWTPGAKLSTSYQYSNFIHSIGRNLLQAIEKERG